MCYLCFDPQTNKVSFVQKEIQAVLIEQGLYLQGEVLLEYNKSKYSICQTFARYIIYKKRKRLNLYKQTKKWSENRIKQLAMLVTFKNNIVTT